jgi:hypothetical protein
MPWDPVVRPVPSDLSDIEALRDLAAHLYRVLLRAEVVRKRGTVEVLRRRLAAVDILAPDVTHEDYVPGETWTQQ